MNILGKKVVIKNKLRFSIFIFILFFSLLSLGMMMYNQVSGYDIPQYDSYLVHKGDTLWSIAKDLTGERMDVREAIYDITTLNEISSSGHIYPGQKLILPNYSY